MTRLSPDFRVRVWLRETNLAHPGTGGTQALSRFFRNGKLGGAWEGGASAVPSK